MLLITFTAQFSLKGLVKRQIAWSMMLHLLLSNPRARGGLFTDLIIYLYGGTSADLSKIPTFWGESLFAFTGKNDQY